MLRPKKKIGPLFTETQFKDVKDPCIVYDGDLWHIYGSGGDVRSEVWQILHAVSPDIAGPWKEVGAATLEGVRGDHVAAPSVFFDPESKQYHMMVQTEFSSIGGTIEYLVSSDGHHFHRIGTALESLPESSEAGIYDPHQSVIGGKKYIVYAGTPAIEGFNNQYIIQPDIYLAQSKTDKWEGPWERKGKILDHDHIDWHHNPRHHKEYEWGIEGPQIIEITNKLILLNATCFLAEGKFGTRQRVFFAVSQDVHGPYISIGPVVEPEEDWESGENGHATAIVKDSELYLFYQARSQKEYHAGDNSWRYGMAVYDLKDIKREFEKHKKY